MVQLVVIARRFRCDAVLCRRQIFTERHPEGVLAPAARRTARLDKIVHHLGLALGGRPAAMFAKRLMLPVSKDTLLRVVRRRSRPASEPLIARDRGGGYGEAAARALPHAVQVADRWHLMENASRAFLDSVRKSMRQVRHVVGATRIDPNLRPAAGSNPTCSTAVLGDSQHSTRVGGDPNLRQVDLDQFECPQIAYGLIAFAMEAILTNTVERDR
jgi:transposase